MIFLNKQFWIQLILGQLGDMTPLVSPPPIGYCLEQQTSERNHVAVRNMIQGNHLPEITPNLFNLGKIIYLQGKLAKMHM